MHFEKKTLMQRDIHRKRETQRTSNRIKINSTDNRRKVFHLIGHCLKYMYIKKEEY